MLSNYSPKSIRRAVGSCWFHVFIMVKRFKQVLPNPFWRVIIHRFHGGALEAWSTHVNDPCVARTAANIAIYNIIFKHPRYISCYSFYRPRRDGTWVKLVCSWQLNAWFSDWETAAVTVSNRDRNQLRKKCSWHSRSLESRAHYTNSRLPRNAITKKETYYIHRDVFGCIV